MTGHHRIQVGWDSGIYFDFCWRRRTRMGSPRLRLWLLKNLEINHVATREPWRFLSTSMAWMTRMWPAREGHWQFTASSVRCASAAGDYGPLDKNLCSLHIHTPVPLLSELMPLGAMWDYALHLFSEIYHQTLLRTGHYTSVDRIIGSHWPKLSNRNKQAM